jgi:hypothetical protein
VIPLGLTFPSERKYPNPNPFPNKNENMTEMETKESNFAQQFRLIVHCNVNPLHDLNAFAHVLDRLCGLVVRVLSYRFGGRGSIPGTTRFSEGKKKQVVGLERSSLSLVSTTEELLDRKIAVPV